MKMQAIQPEIQRLQKKYKDDPQRMNREQQKLMKERGVSMWGSCLPMLITCLLYTSRRAARPTFLNCLTFRRTGAPEESGNKMRCPAPAAPHRG